ncbi:MAG: NAD(P)H-dependent oxidoreductase [Blautia sp.]|nr:NAD(P)H-dependent oxidoreductase [Blautia sp.]
MAKTLIAYFSHAGENYSHGEIRNLPVGNTEVVAKKIHTLIDSDLFYIDTVQKYPDDHMKKIEVAKREFQENARPALTKRVENMDDYDTVIVAFPNWWTTMPMALFTFFESYDFSGKTICPLITHGGSGFSNSLQDIKRLCPEAHITEGLAILGDKAASCDREVERWLKKIRLR